MTKGKKWTLRLLGVAVLALLICLCLMGSTMARYTSSGNGSGSLTVALWDVETATLSFEGQSVSPSEEKYGEGTGAVTGTTGARENESGWVGSFVIQNNSDVDALVTFEAGSEYTIGWPDAKNGEGTAIYEDPEWSWGVGWTDSSLVDSNGNPTGKAQTNEYGADLMNHFGTTDTSDGEAAFEAIVNENKIFTLQFGFGVAYETEDSPVVPETPEDDENITKIDATYLASNDGVLVKSGYSVCIYAEVVWTSISCTESEEYKAANNENLYADFTSAEEYSDAVDTILGMYAQELTFAVTWTAVQNSTLPPQP